MPGLDDNRWRPILDGELAEAAWSVIDDIAGELLARAEADQDTPLNPSLAAGDAGQALLFAYLARAQPGRGHDDRAVWFLDRAFDAIAEQPVGPGLYGGYSGAAWVAEHLRGAVGLLDEGEDTNGDVDAALVEVLASPPPDGNFDLVGGLVGVGAYALERMPHGGARDILERVVAHLSDMAERDARGAVWITHRDDEPGPVIDLGVAHGVAGVIALLGEACRLGVAHDVARPLLEAAFTGLRARALPPGGTARYAAIVPVHAMEPPPPTRSAWCYGDPGIAAALLAAARGTGNRGWEEEARALARVAAARPEQEAGVVDAGLCHGAAGLAHVFLRLHRATGEPSCGDAARHWFARTIDMRRRGEGIAGYRAWHPDHDWFDDPTLLTGAAGIALVLLGAVTPFAPDWDRMLLTTLAPASAA